MHAVSLASAQQVCDLLKLEANKLSLRMKKPCVYDRAYTWLLNRSGPEFLAVKNSDIAPYPSLQSFQRDDSPPSGCTPSFPPLFTIDDYGNAHLDPFRTYPSELSPECISEVLTYCRFSSTQTKVYMSLTICPSNQRDVAKIISRFHSQRHVIYSSLDVLCDELPCIVQCVAPFGGRALTTSCILQQPKYNFV